MGRCKSLGSLKSFLSYASQLSGASILCFLISGGSGCNLMAATSQVFFLSAFRAHQLIFSQFSSVQFSRSVASDSATPWTAACQACLSIASSRSLLKLMSIEFVMPPAISSSVIPFSFHLQYWRVAQLSLMTVTSLFTDMAGNNPFSHI